VSGSKMAIVVPEDLQARVREVARTILRAPFTRRTWSEFLFLVVGAVLAAFGLVFVGTLMGAGIALAVTFIGLAVVGLAVRGARGWGGLHRDLARGLLNEQIEDPPPFVHRPGFLGWLQAVLRDRVGWRAMAYLVVKGPVAFLGIMTALSIWIDAFTCLMYPFSNHSQPSEFGVALLFFRPSGFLSVQNAGFLHGIAIVCTGAILLFAAPWATRAVVSLDRFFLRGLLGPGAMAVRVRSLEHARAQTVDASVATLRRIERDLHDGTQAQLVALAMRLGLAKEKLAALDDPDLSSVRDLVDDAHRGAKEAIVELRDLARGIHPPALDLGLEGALSTLASRSTVPTELTLALSDRPTPAIETIAYFCVAELLANVAQHANASRASVTCAQHGGWLRLVVRDDGLGGAQLSQLGSTSSGLTGLTDRVRAVDGRLDIVSPLRGPTVVTVDLPLHA
jgi:signal transduction histidine kinase